LSSEGRKKSNKKKKKSLYVNPVGERGGKKKAATSHCRVSLLRPEAKKGPNSLHLVEKNAGEGGKRKKRRPSRDPGASHTPFRPNFRKKERRIPRICFCTKKVLRGLPPGRGPKENDAGKRKEKEKEFFLSKD